MTAIWRASVLGIGVGELRRQAQAGVVDQHVEPAESARSSRRPGVRASPGRPGRRRSSATSRSGCSDRSSSGQPIEPIAPAGGQDQGRALADAGPALAPAASPMPADAPVIRMTGRRDRPAARRPSAHVSSNEFRDASRPARSSCANPTASRPRDRPDRGSPIAASRALSMPS